MTRARGFIIAGTDTDVGKTVFAAALSDAIGARYWKPIQSGLDGGGDAAVVRDLAGLGDDRIVPEVYRLTHPLSPHRAAELDGVVIDPARLAVPRVEGPLVIELAGGLLVPLTRSVLQADVTASWGLPLILVARTRLGTINHSLLSIEAARRRGMVVHGIAFAGDSNEDSERTICEFGGVPRLGRLPQLDPLDGPRLRAAFAAAFRREDFV